MAQAPAADQRRLLDVQDADIRIAQAHHRRTTLPVQAQLEELVARRADLNASRALLTAEVSDLQREVTKAEDDVLAVRAREDRDAKRLASGEGSARDLQALQAELEVLAKRRSDLEDVELDAMTRLEDAQTRQASAQTQVAALDEQVAALHATLEAEHAALDAELAQIEAERRAAVNGIDPTLVALYERLRATGGGIGAAALVRGQCQGCHMTLNAGDLTAIRAAAPTDVVRCEECGRILVRGEDA